MAANNILPFSPTDTGSNLLSDAAYAAASDRTTGHAPGIASLRLANKAARQSSLMAALIAQLLADRQATDISDSMSLATLNTLFIQVLGKTVGTRNLVSFLATTNWTVPANVYRIRARLWGGGGGGGGVNNGAAAGGTGGGYAEGWYDVSPGQVVTVTVGAAGAGGTGAPTGGSNGGTTSVGAFVNATGGSGGQGASGGNLAPVNTGGGTGNAGQLNVPGNAANAGLSIGGVLLGSAGGGAFCTSLLGGVSYSSGNGAAFPGGGGGGAGGASFAAGTAGASGLATIEW